jgi:hypothetical protein
MEERTIYGFALSQVVVMLAGEEAVPISSDNALNKAVGHQLTGVGRFEKVSVSDTYPLFTLKKSPSMMRW